MTRTITATRTPAPSRTPPGPGTSVAPAPPWTQPGSDGPHGGAAGAPEASGTPGAGSVNDSGPAAREVSRLRRQELASFLRSRRERISPQQLGLPSYGRRRTPGLRREEVAQLAGVGLTWYTWLEQGRDINVTPGVLDAIARTLQLDADERSHLFTLAGSPLADIARECNAVPTTVHLLVRGLEPYPAVVTNARKNVLAYNRAFDAMVGPLGAIPPEERNILWLMYTSPAWRRLLVDWDTDTARMVAQFRGAMAEHVGDPTYKCLLDRLLAASPDFAAVWRRHEVESAENRTKRLLHPRVGLLRLDYTHLWLGPRSGVRLTAYTPADADAQRRLAELTAPNGD